MPSINPIQTLNRYADHMISSVVNNTPAKNTYIRNFLREANMNKTQGNALVAYYTGYNKSLKEASFGFNNSDVSLRRLEQLPEIIEKSVNEFPAIQQEADIFVGEMSKNYPKTLTRRISIAAHGGVEADRVKPKSRWNKFLILLNEFMLDVKDNIKG